MEDVACELCGSRRAHVFLSRRDLRLYVSQEEFMVVRCEECELLYLNPRPTRAEIGKFYPSQYYESPSPPRRFSKIKRWIMEDFYGYPTLAPPGPWGRLRKLLLWPEKVRRSLSGRDILPWVGRGRLLDVGCGHGVKTAMLKDQGWDVHGLDLNEDAVGHTRSLLGDRVQLGDLISVRYQDRSFDVVQLSHSLEHMYDPLSVLAEARRILDDGGVLVITVPNAGSVEVKIFGQYWEQWDLPRHFYHFDQNSLARLLEKAGFRMILARTAVSSACFMASLNRMWAKVFCRNPLARWLVERLIARPFCLLAGHLRYGTEITVHAVKAQAGEAYCVSE